jgi:hypothetical protein
MIRFIGLFSTCFLTLSMFEGPAAGQAMVENALAAGATAGTATPARSLKNGIGGMFDTLDKTLKSAQDQTDLKERSSGIIQLDAPPTAKPKTAGITTPAQPPPGDMVHDMVHALPPPAYEDPATIQVGMGYEELLRRFGPPALEFTDGPNRKIMSYLRKSGGVQVEFRDGKVTSAEKPKL